MRRPFGYISGLVYPSFQMQYNKQVSLFCQSFVIVVDSIRCFYDREITVICIPL
jgi:hypothetical protein